MPKIDIVKWVGIGTKVVPLIIGAVNAVEKLMSAAKGKEKQDAAVTMVAAMLAAIEGGIDKDLLNDGEVQKAVRAVIDAVVALQNVVASAKAAAELAKLNG